MLNLMIQKELKSIINSPKFAATFGACSLLILLSMFVGINEYEESVKAYDTARQLNEQRMAESSSWLGLTNQIFRKPQVMQIFSSGIQNDVGRFSGISNWEGVKLRRSSYSDDPIFAVFRYIDFTFITQVALSLLAILFTYDAINGERERGTLKLTFANAVPRVKYILAKFIGSTLGLVVPLLVPILIGLLMLLLYQVPVTGDDWVKIVTIIFISILFFVFFIAAGLMVSAMSRHSSTSFMILLVAWVTMVLIIPRAGVMLAGQLVDIPSVAEIESQQAAYEQAAWNTHYDNMEERRIERRQRMNNMSQEEKDLYEEENMWGWMEEEEKERKSIQKEIADNNRKLMENHRNRRGEQERLGFLMSRFSPASSYQLACMTLANTNIAMKSGYEDALHQYRTDFVSFISKKQEETGGHGGISISIDSEKGFSFSGNRGIESLDMSEIPKFEAPKHSISLVAGSTVIDLGILAFYTIAAFAIGFAAFLRYDVR